MNHDRGLANEDRILMIGLSSEDEDPIRNGFCGKPKAQKTVEKWDD